jgi:hypothetical protein
LLFLTGAPLLFPRGRLSSARKRRPATALFRVVAAIGIAATVRIAVRMRRLDEPERRQHAVVRGGRRDDRPRHLASGARRRHFLANGSSVVPLGVAIVRYRPFDIEVGAGSRRGLRSADRRSGRALFGADVAAGLLGVLATTGSRRREGQPLPVLTDRELEILT